MEGVVQKKLQSLIFAPIIIVLITVLGAHNVFGETKTIPKDPAFARRLGLTTGVITPLVLTMVGMGISTSSHDDETQLFVGQTITYIGILTPPLGNVYAGKIDKRIALLYGGANLSYIIGMISYYWEGATTRQPNTFEGLMWFFGVLIRIPAGVWDWMTASETAVMRNVEIRGVEPKGYIRPFLIPAENSLNVGISYNLNF